MFIKTPPQVVEELEIEGQKMDNFNTSFHKIVCAVGHIFEV